MARLSSQEIMNVLFSHLDIILRKKGKLTTLGGQGRLRGVTLLPCKLGTDFFKPQVLGMGNHLGPLCQEDFRRGSVTGIEEDLGEDLNDVVSENVRENVEVDLEM